MDPDWQHCRSLLATLRLGSLSAAARSLGLAQPTLGRHIVALETALGQPLFTRSTGGLNATAAALALRPMAEAMEAAAAAMQRSAGRAAAPDAGGTVRITASEMVGAEVLPPILSRIQAAHPRIILELALTNRAEDLLRRDADIAVRMLRPTQQALLARRLGSVRLGLFAQADYLARHGMPGTVASLDGHHLVGFDRDGRAAAALGEDHPLRLGRERFSFRSDSDLAQAAAIRAGLGIGVMQAAIAARWTDLHPVLAREVGFNLEVWLALHEDQRDNPTIRVVRDGLAKGLAGWLA